MKDKTKDAEQRPLETLVRSEYILCAAIYYADGKARVHQPKNINSGIVVCGRRHHNCLAIMSEFLEKPNRTKIIQGFLTNTDRFVDRQEAAKIALEAGQVDSDLSRLVSEDVY